MPVFESAGTIIQDAAVECGLASVADPYAANDAISTQMRTLLKAVGRYLRRRKGWTHLQYTHTLNTTANVASYALPPDYGIVIGQTQWNRTNRLPQGGPLSPQDFQYLKSRLVGVVFTTLHRFIQNRFLVYPDTVTPGNYVLAFEYVSNYWAIPAATPVPVAWNNNTTYANGAQVRNSGNIYTAVQVGNGVSGAFGPLGTGAGIVDNTCTWNFASAAGAELPTQSSDLVQFESWLASRALKLAYKRAHRFATDDDFDEYKAALEDASSEDTPGELIRLDKGSGDYMLLGERNVPITGFGGT